MGQERRWTLAREEADLRGNKLKWNAVIIMHELGCCEAQGGSKGGTRRLAPSRARGARKYAVQNWNTV